MDDEKLKETSELKVKRLPLIAIRGVSVFPHTEVRFEIDRERSVHAMESAMANGNMVFLAAQKDYDTDLPTAKEIYSVGTVARIKRVLKLPGERYRILVVGIERGKLKGMVQESPFFLADVRQMEPDPTVELTEAVQALMRTASSLFAEYKSTNKNFPAEEYHDLEPIDQPGELADYIGAQMDLKPEDSQKILRTSDPVKRLSTVIKLMNREIEIYKLESRLSSKLQTRISKSQKEQYLREQMRTIQEELGQDDDISSEVEEWRRKLKKLKLDEAVSSKIEKEIDKASKMPSYAQELYVIRNYIEWILDLPWNDSSETSTDLIKAKEVLDSDHYGLEKVKDRIIEYLAVQKLAGKDQGSILCLVGPPGVGKTSVARSIARASGRGFVHMSLGGVRDEAEIRGHRKTYIGAIPGRIISLIRDAGTRNPVFLFDEVDKIGSDYKGDPASALLEVLDPAQNKEFVDHYLEVPFDLSDVMFITTANTTETIPSPLLDRMEVIELSGYTEEEKLNIAKKYLVPKQIKANGLKSSDISIYQDAIKSVISGYTRESGVRNLEKQIGSICRKAARKKVEGQEGRFTVKAADLEEYLGKRKYHYDKLLGKNEVGVSTGLAWTSVGGETLFIETAVLPGSGKLELTGQLGDVMQESARAAISYIRAHCDRLGVDADFYKTKDIHIHIPEGATPKDGPSAGVTMCISAVSALSGRPVRKDVAMTGEISLRGKILPIGGLKEKSLAAHRMGISKVLVPAENKPDLEDIPKSVKDDMEFVLISSVDDAVREALI